MRNHAILKLNQVKGPRLPYPIQEAEVRENEYSYLEGSGILILDGEGALYWVHTFPTSDAGTSRVYDSNAASGNTVEADYGNKALNGQFHSFDPPIPYKHGLYVTLVNSIVQICYKPFARNLRCKLSVLYGPGLTPLVCKVTVGYAAATEDLVCRVSPIVDGYTALVSRVIVAYTDEVKNLVLRVTVYKDDSKALVCRLYADRTP